MFDSLIGPVLKANYKLTVNCTIPPEMFHMAPIFERKPAETTKKPGSSCMAVAITSRNLLGDSELDLGLRITDSRSLKLGED